tara:strand:- start:17 stop:457 length:441 start_codon:yes stop_codon:yes gene_type:complete
MIILQPITTVQTISIMPRERNYLSVDKLESRVAQNQSVLEAKTCVTEAIAYFNNTTIELRRDGDGMSETITGIKSIINQNYIELSFSSNILKEGSAYLITVKEDDRLIYRDKIYATTQNDYKVKHIVSQTGYKSPQVSDNTYILNG